MSIALSLTSAVIISAFSLTSVGAAQVVANLGNAKEDEEKITSFDTVFLKADLLEETIKAHGCGMKRISENEIVVDTECGVMRYIRESEDVPFKLEMKDIKDKELFANQLESFEKEYGRNVQDYTYNHVKNNLPDNMRIVSEEVAEDDSLVLTIEL